ncbi:MAG: hypothetical protein WBM17_10915 [Anaerolineales bacterium]
MVGILVRVGVEAAEGDSVGDAIGVFVETVVFVAAFHAGDFVEVFSGTVGGGIVGPAAAEIPAQPVIKNTAASKGTGIENRVGIRFFEVIIQPK